MKWTEIEASRSSCRRSGAVVESCGAELRQVCVGIDRQIREFGLGMLGPSIGPAGGGAECAESASIGCGVVLMLLP